MADFYTWTDPQSMERRAIELFLSKAEARAMAQPDSLPMKRSDALLTIGWLRGVLDRKPSELLTP